MPTVRFQNLTCVQTEDEFGPDEAILLFFRDGEYLGNLQAQLSNGDVMALGFDLEFVNDLRVMLFEIDNPALGDPHDFLGEVTINGGNLAGIANLNRAVARYQLTWQAAGGVPPTVTRRNEANMSNAERTRFLNALDALVQSGQYAQLVENHAGPLGDMPYRNHGAMPGMPPIGYVRFLPWHRAYLLEFEQALRNVDP